MLPQIPRMSPSRRSFVALALLAALQPGAALADEDSIEVDKLLTKKIIVQSNGSSYSHVPNAPVSVQVHIKADAEISGRVKKWTAHFELVREDNIFIDLSPAALTKVYPFNDRPKTVDRIEKLTAFNPLWENQVRVWCNELADELRGEGLTDKDIFAEDRTFKLMVKPRLDVEYTGATGLQQADGPPTYKADKPQIEVVCQKWAGAVGPVAAGGIAVQTPEVLDLGLNIVEQATINGVCKIRLDGWITADLKNVDIAYRFENEEGNLTPLLSANTGASKTATFSRWENVGSHPQGQVRIVGDGFESDWVSYDLNCVTGGPGQITANLPPKVTLTMIPHGAVMVYGRVCPASVKLIGMLEGQGTVSGQAIFYGSSYFSPLRDYSITPGEKVLLGAEAPLDWHNAHEPLSDNMPLILARGFGLNVTGENNTVIASVPVTSRFFECKWPKVNPMVQGEPKSFAAEPSQPAVSATAIQMQPKIKRPETPTLKRPTLRQRLRRNGN